MDFIYFYFIYFWPLSDSGIIWTKFYRTIPESYVCDDSYNHFTKMLTNSERYATKARQMSQRGEVINVFHHGNCGTINKYGV